MNRRALIIDDNKDLADGLSAVLEIDDIDSVVAYNGEDGLNMLARQDFDVCITDVKLPDMCGIDIFAAAVRKNPGMQTVIMSGFRIEQVMDEILDKCTSLILHTDINPENINNIFSSETDVCIVFVVDRSNSIDITNKEFTTGLDYRKITVVSSFPESGYEFDQLKDKELVIIDLGNPAVWAIAIASKLHKLNPSIRMIIKAPDIDIADATNPLQSYNVTGCLFKPFNPDKILDLIHIHQQSDERSTA